MHSTRSKSQASKACPLHQSSKYACTHVFMCPLFCCRYGAHLSREQVAELAMPHPNTLDLVYPWFEYSAGVPPASVSVTHGGSSLSTTGVSVSRLTISSARHTSSTGMPRRTRSFPARLATRFSRRCTGTCRLTQTTCSSPPLVQQPIPRKRSNGAGEVCIWRASDGAVEPQSR